jgi:hypothetical protein
LLVLDRAAAAANSAWTGVPCTTCTERMCSPAESGISPHRHALNHQRGCTMLTAGWQ